MFDLFNRKNKKILVILGQEDSETFCGDLAGIYVDSASKAGHEVRRVNIGDLQFDPLLHKGYKVIQELEPDLKKLQEDFKWAEHVVIFYPMWWSGMPAILKGLFDRMWLPGFAFHFNKTIGWKMLLKGKSGRVFVTMDSWPSISRFMFGDSTNEICRAILGFAGFFPVKVMKVGPLKNASLEHRKMWEEKISCIAKKGK